MRIEEGSKLAEFLASGGVAINIIRSDGETFLHLEGDQIDQFYSALSQIKGIELGPKGQSEIGAQKEPLVE